MPAVVAASSSPGEQAVPARQLSRLEAPRITFEVGRHKQIVACEGYQKQVIAPSRSYLGGISLCRLRTSRRGSLRLRAAPSLYYLPLQSDGGIKKNSR